ncbi:hypothetical protein QN277_015543 [Acacia crassicarpa]|uniref:Uncharacterized protein n=1 Tax=Acacia crassicarpa TaxID=499986 RepID=A0AAE1KKG3_9FABA|nr:hypothetical protein QN277_015543 [Acacia crassicarpa]
MIPPAGIGNCKNGVDKMGANEGRGLVMMLASPCHAHIAPLIQFARSLQDSDGLWVREIRNGKQLGFQEKNDD